MISPLRAQVSSVFHTEQAEPTPPLPVANLIKESLPSWKNTELLSIIRLSGALPETEETGGDSTSFNCQENMTSEEARGLIKVGITYIFMLPVHNNKNKIARNSKYRQKTPEWQLRVKNFHFRRKKSAAESKTPILMIKTNVFLRSKNWKRV